MRARATAPSAADERRDTRHRRLFSGGGAPHVVEGDDAESIDVIKFVAPWCRLCKSVSLKLASTANKFPGASFYEVLMVKDTEPCLLYTSPSPRDRG